MRSPFTMRHALIRIAAALVILVCLGCHLSEVLDSWDHMLQTGDDIDYTVAVVAVLTGAVLACIGVAFRLVSKARRTDFRSCLCSVRAPVVPFLGVPPTPSPPLSLRI